VDAGSISEMMQIMEDDRVKRIRLVIKAGDEQKKIRLQKRMLF